MCRLRLINDSVLSSLKMEGKRFFFEGGGETVCRLHKKTTEKWPQNPTEEEVFAVSQQSLCLNPVTNRLFPQPYPSAEPQYRMDEELHLFVTQSSVASVV
jgi:hypothetical protein